MTRRLKMPTRAPRPPTAADSNRSAAAWGRQFDGKQYPLTLPQGPSAMRNQMGPRASPSPPRQGWWDHLRKAAELTDSKSHLLFPRGVHTLCMMH